MNMKVVLATSPRWPCQLWAATLLRVVPTALAVSLLAYVLHSWHTSALPAHHSVLLPAQQRHLTSYSQLAPAVQLNSSLPSALHMCAPDHHYQVDHLQLYSAAYKKTVRPEQWPKVWLPALRSWLYVYEAEKIDQEIRLLYMLLPISRVTEPHSYFINKKTEPYLSYLLNNTVVECSFDGATNTRWHGRLSSVEPFLPEYRHTFTYIHCSLSPSIAATAVSSVSVHLSFKPSSRQQLAAEYLPVHQHSDAVQLKGKMLTSNCIWKSALPTSLTRPYALRPTSIHACAEAAWLSGYNLAGVGYELDKPECRVGTLSNDTLLRMIEKQANAGACNVSCPEQPDYSCGAHRLMSVYSLSAGTSDFVMPPDIRPRVHSDYSTQWTEGNWHGAINAASAGNSFTLTIPLCRPPADALQSSTAVESTLFTQALHPPVGWSQLVQWIDYNLYIGFDRVLVHDRFGDLRQSLQSYSSKRDDRVQYVYWPLPIDAWYTDNSIELRSWDQFYLTAATAMRNRHTTQWLAHFDFDEYLQITEHPQTATRDHLPPNADAGSIVSRYLHAVTEMGGPDLAGITLLSIPFTRPVMEHLATWHQQLLVDCQLSAVNSSDAARFVHRLASTSYSQRVKYMVQPAKAAVVDVHVFSKLPGHYNLTVGLQQTWPYCPSHVHPRMSSLVDRARINHYVELFESAEGKRAYTLSSDPGIHRVLDTTMLPILHQSAQHWQAIEHSVQHSSHNQLTAGASAHSQCVADYPSIQDTKSSAQPGLPQFTLLELLNASAGHLPVALSTITAHSKQSHYMALGSTGERGGQADTVVVKPCDQTCLTDDATVRWLLEYNTATHSAKLCSEQACVQLGADHRLQLHGPKNDKQQATVSPARFELLFTADDPSVLYLTSSTSTSRPSWYVACAASKLSTCKLVSKQTAATRWKIEPWYGCAIASQPSESVITLTGVVR